MPRGAATFEADVDRQVIQPLMQSGQVTAHPSSAAAAAAANDDHPSVVLACRRLIETLHQSLQVRVPSIHAISDAVQKLKSLCADFERSDASTPPLPSNVDTTLAPPHNVSPRALSARSDAQEYRTKVGRRWIFVCKSCALIRTSIQDGEDDDVVADEIHYFLARLHDHRSDFASEYDKLVHFDILDAIQQRKLSDATRQAIRNAIDIEPALSDDETLHYVLICLPLAPVLIEDNSEEEPLRDHFARQLGRVYRGDAHHRLLRFASQVKSTLFRPDTDGSLEKQPYFKGTPIVQSSGTGKTRMVLELGRVAPLLFVCVRPDSTTSARNGFPLGDQPIMEFIFRDCAVTTAHPDQHAAALLGAWFKTLASDLAALPDDAKLKFDHLVRLNTYNDAEHGNSCRESFFNRVSVAARGLLSQMISSPKEDFSTMFSRVLDHAVFSLSAQLQQVQDFLALNDPAARQYPVFVAIDECVTLPPRLLESFRRAWNHIGTLEGARHDGSTCVCFWLILMSTNSSASNLVRPQKEQSSDRERNAPRLPTFVGVGFDVLRSEQRPLLSADEVADIDHVKLYGRPLWASLIRQSLWPVAVKKLQGTEKFERGVREICFNVLASRLALRYLPILGADGSVFGEQLAFTQRAVDRHMRILAKVDTDCNLHIRSPSEPVLAVAASLIMLPTPNEENKDQVLSTQMAANRYGSIIETVKQTCLSSPKIDLLRGTRGEFVVRLLLMAAWDAAKITAFDYPKSSDPSTRASYLLKPVPLMSILTNLVHLDAQQRKTVHDRIDRACLTVQRSLSGGDHHQVDAWTHFTHFDNLDVKLEEISQKYLWYCWKRGVAIQMHHEQDGIDGIIPVFIGNLHRRFAHDEPVDPESALPHQGAKRPMSWPDPTELHGELEATSQMTFIAWEAKNRSSYPPNKASAAAKKPFHAGPKVLDESGHPVELSTRGLFTVVADVGSTSQSPQVADIKQADSLQIWIRGIDHESAYPCLNTLNIRNVFTGLLRQVSDRWEDYEGENTLPNPMDLDQAELHATQSVKHRRRSVDEVMDTS